MQRENGDIEQSAFLAWSHCTGQGTHGQCSSAPVDPQQGCQGPHLYFLVVLRTCGKFTSDKHHNDLCAITFCYIKLLGA